MIPLIVLLLGYCFLYILNKTFLKNKISTPLTGLIPVSLLLIFSGIAHFFYTETMVDMMPEIIPFKLELVYITGIIELIAAYRLISKKWRKLAGILLIIFLLAVLPANIIGSIKRLPAAGMERGLDYLYFRIPLQFFFMGWIYCFAIFYRSQSSSKQSDK